MNRKLLIKTNNIKEVKRLLIDNEKKIFDRNLIYEIKKSDIDYVQLIGYDWTVKATYDHFNKKVLQDIFDKIDRMPMRSLDRQIRRENKNKIGGDLKLYTDERPRYTVKGLGYRDAKIANKTLKLIKNRSIKYQKVTVMALYYRAKYHKNRTKDMEEAMKIFKTWINKNKNKKRKYPYLPLQVVKKYEKLAEEYGVSEVSRGKKKSTKSDKGFLVMYKKYKDPEKLSFIPAKLNDTAGNDYDSLREKFLNARLGQMKKSKTKLYTKELKPTKQHVVLIMNAYSPDKKLYSY